MNTAVALAFVFYGDEEPQDRSWGMREMIVRDPFRMGVSTEDAKNSG